MDYSEVNFETTDSQDEKTRVTLKNISIEKICVLILRKSKSSHKENNNAGYIENHLGISVTILNEVLEIIII